MANFGDFRGSLNEIASHLRYIEKNTQCLVCASEAGSSPDVNSTITNPTAISGPIVTASNANAVSIVNAIITGQNSTPHITSAGVNTAIPAGFKSVGIIKTSAAGTVNITLSDGSIFPLTAENELFSDAASQYYILPAYAIATANAATWKWHGIK